MQFTFFSASVQSDTFKLSTSVKFEKKNSHNYSSFSLKFVTTRNHSVAKNIHGSMEKFLIKLNMLLDAKKFDILNLILHVR